MSNRDRPKEVDGVIEAAGGLLWKTDDSKRLIALIHRPQYDDWTLPKGWREEGESWEQTAEREVREETNCSVVLLDFAGCTCYQVGRVPKVVLYWHMEVTGEEEFIENNETDILIWMTKKKALARLSYANERKLVENSWPRQEEDN